jgi:hypothetical protein
MFMADKDQSQDSTPETVIAQTDEQIWGEFEDQDKSLETKGEDGDQPNVQPETTLTADEEQKVIADLQSQVNDIWANATPEQKAAFEAASQQGEAFAQYKRSNEGRIAAFQRQIDELKQVLNQKDQTTQQAAVDPAAILQDPKVQKLKDDYPDIYEPIETLIGSVLNQTSAVAKTAESAVQKIQQTEQSQAVDREVETLAKTHPDWLEQVNSKEFPEWLQAQPNYVQEVVRRNAQAITNAEEAAHVLGMFKRDRGIGVSTAPTKRDDTTTRRKAQIDSSAGPANRGAGGAVVSGIPAEGDPQQIWDQFEQLDRQQSFNTR